MEFSKAERWFETQGWQVFAFQRAAWDQFAAGGHAMINAPTGSGKTYSLMMPILLSIKPKSGLQAIWVTPIRALSKEILQSGVRAAEGMSLSVEIAIRTGDTEAKDKSKLKKSPPDILITTPETLHVLLSQKGYAQYFKQLKTIVFDEWHDLVGSKRGVQCELALARLKSLTQGLKIFGISATIGNMDEAFHVLLGTWNQLQSKTIIRSEKRKLYVVESIFPDRLDELPWAGHLGLKLAHKILPILQKSQSTLVFLNTRAQAELWYQKLLEISPELAGIIALHHGSMSRETRHWVEDALHASLLKVVICTSSLDLGVDFRPVETIIQVGSPKGVARFMQRAGRSGHQPGAKSKIYFLPTHSLELIEVAALREAIDVEFVESRIPCIRSFDVLIQFMVTLAVSDGFDADELFEEVRGTFCFESITEDEWHWCLNFIVHGGESLGGYDEFHKVVRAGNRYSVTSKRVALRHRFSIGTIVSDTILKVKWLSGGYLGSIEEYFISRLSTGDNFWFAGNNLELVRIKELTVQVRKSNKTSGPTPSWQGGRMPLSSQMSKMLRKKLNEAALDQSTEPEIIFLKPMIAKQQEGSILPQSNQLLIEVFESSDGYHMLVYPFEGRFVHEGMAALVAYRIARIKPITFSIAMNDYGFELLSDQPIPLKEAIEANVFSSEHLMTDILASVNSVEMSRRRFREIAAIAGLVFNGYPGKHKKERHLQASAQLFFNVFNDYDPKNLLLRQSFDEVMDFQLEEARMKEALERIAHQQIQVTHPPRFTPLAFPIIVDRLREKLTTERIEERIKRMTVAP